MSFAAGAPGEEYGIGFDSEQLRFDLGIHIPTSWDIIQAIPIFTFEPVVPAYVYEPPPIPVVDSDPTAATSVSGVLDEPVDGGEETTAVEIGWVPFPGIPAEDQEEIDASWEETIRIPVGGVLDEPRETREAAPEDEMAVDWGGVVDAAIDVWQGQVPGGGSPSYAPYVPSQPGTAPMPETVTVNTKTGKVTTCKRRRRRRLLTESDFNDLMRISTLPNKEPVRIALAKAVGRRA